jgi:endonuclease-8
MEGPSIFLAVEWLSPLEGQKVKRIKGNTKIGKERLRDQKLVSIFSFGKYLFFQFEVFALRVHFLLYGSFEAIIKGHKVTGDYPTRAREARLALEFTTGSIAMYNCSLVFIENPHAKEACDFSIDLMSEAWDSEKALAKIKDQPDSEIADVLLDQSIFMGAGNIIKNEVLLLAKMDPQRKVSGISEDQLKSLVSLARSYVFQFYEWRKHFVLKKHYRIYRQSKCKQCDSKVIRKKTGSRNRMSYICPHCQQ